MRIDKLLELSGCGSRGQVKKLLRSQQVVVDDQVIRDGAVNVDTAWQKVVVSQKRICNFSHVYYVLHKPIGVVTAVTDKIHQTVLDCLDSSDKREGLYPVGRLDRDTSGLVLLTDNGPIGFAMLHPDAHVSKVYKVVVNGELTAEHVAQFKEGVLFLDGYVCRSAKLDIVSRSSTESVAFVTISEGKFHQVKKMFLSIGVKVTQLTRVAFGPLQLEDLPVGQYRPLSDVEIMKMKYYLK